MLFRRQREQLKVYLRCLSSSVIRLEADNRDLRCAVQGLIEDNRRLHSRLMALRQDVATNTDQALKNQNSSSLNYMALSVMSDTVSQLRETVYDLRGPFLSPRNLPQKRN